MQLTTPLGKVTLNKSTVRTLSDEEFSAMCIDLEDDVARELARRLHSLSHGVDGGRVLSLITDARTTDHVR